MVSADRIADPKSLEYNAQRRHRYATDLAYRERQKRRAAVLRTKATKVDWITRGGVKLFRIGAVARRIKRSEKTLRFWESLKLIPPCSVRRPGGHRVYLDHQVKLIERLAGAIPRGRPGADGVPGHKAWWVGELILEIRRLW